MAQNIAPTPSVFADLRCLLRQMWQQMSPRRRRQFRWSLLALVLGVGAELMALGAILPFLALMADPAGIRALPVLGDQLGMVLAGWGDPRLLACLIFVTAAILAGCCRLLLAWVSQRMAFALAHDIGAEVFWRGLSESYEHYLQQNAGKLLADMEKAQLVALNVLVPGVNALTAAVLALCLLAALLMIDPLSALCAAFGFGVLYFLVSRLLRRRFERNSRVVAGLQLRRFQLLQEGAGAIREILLQRLQPAYLRRFQGLDQVLRRCQAENAFLSAAPRFLFEALGMVVIALVALLLTWRAGGFATALPAMGGLALGAVRLLPLLQLIFNGWAQLASHRQSLRDLLAVLAAPLPLHRPAADPVAPSPPQLAQAVLPFDHEIELKDLGFRYAGAATWVFKGLNLRLPRGARLGIIGRTGAGKSTLTDLVLGLLAPTAGQICVDGEPLTPARLPAWQMRVAHVPQSLYFADASLAENVAFGLPAEAIDLARLQMVLAQSALSELVAALPLGIWHPLGEQGLRLSGGQRQRLGIARALYHAADVLVLDEATSALDSQTESAVMAALDALPPEVTVFVVAHRWSSLQGCALILDLPSGLVRRREELCHA